MEPHPALRAVLAAWQNASRASNPLDRLVLVGAAQRLLRCLPYGVAAPESRCPPPSEQDVAAAWTTIARDAEHAAHARVPLLPAKLTEGDRETIRRVACLRHRIECFVALEDLFANPPGAFQWAKGAARSIDSALAGVAYDLPSALRLALDLDDVPPARLIAQLEQIPTWWRFLFEAGEIREWATCPTGCYAPTMATVLERVRVPLPPSATKGWDRNLVEAIDASLGLVSFEEGFEIETGAPDTDAFGQHLLSLAEQRASLEPAILALLGVVDAPEGLLLDIEDLAADIFHAARIAVETPADGETMRFLHAMEEWVQDAIDVVTDHPWQPILLPHHLRDYLTSRIDNAKPSDDPGVTIDLDRLRSVVARSASELAPVRDVNTALSTAVQDAACLDAISSGLHRLGADVQAGLLRALDASASQWARMHRVLSEQDGDARSDVLATAFVSDGLGCHLNTLFALFGAAHRTKEDLAAALAWASAIEAAGMRNPSLRVTAFMKLWPVVSDVAEDLNTSSTESTSASDARVVARYREWFDERRIAIPCREWNAAVDAFGVRKPMQIASLLANLADLERHRGLRLGTTGHRNDAVAAYVSSLAWAEAFLSRGEPQPLAPTREKNRYQRVRTRAARVCAGLSMLSQSRSDTLAYAERGLDLLPAAASTDQRAGRALEHARLAVLRFAGSRSFGHAQQALEELRALQSDHGEVTRAQRKTTVLWFCRLASLHNTVPEADLRTLLHPHVKDGDEAAHDLDTVLQHAVDDDLRWLAQRCCEMPHDPSPAFAACRLVAGANVQESQSDVDPVFTYVLGCTIEWVKQGPAAFPTAPGPLSVAVTFFTRPQAADSEFGHMFLTALLSVLRDQPPRRMRALPAPIVKVLLRAARQSSAPEVREHARVQLFSAYGDRSLGQPWDRQAEPILRLYGEDLQQQQAALAQALAQIRLPEVEAPVSANSEAIIAFDLGRDDWSSGALWRGELPDSAVAEVMWS